MGKERLRGMRHGVSTATLDYRLHRFTFTSDRPTRAGTSGLANMAGRPMTGEDGLDDGPLSGGSCE